MNEELNKYIRSMSNPALGEDVKAGFLKSVDTATNGVTIWAKQLDAIVDPPAILGGKRRRRKTPKRRRVRKSTFRRHRKH